MEKQIDDTHNYPKYHECSYYFGEIDARAIGKDDILYNLEKKRHDKTEKKTEIGD